MNSTSCLHSSRSICSECCGNSVWKSISTVLCYTENQWVYLNGTPQCLKQVASSSVIRRSRKTRAVIQYKQTLILPKSPWVKTLSEHLFTLNPTVRLVWSSSWNDSLSFQGFIITFAATSVELKSKSSTWIRSQIAQDRCMGTDLCYKKKKRKKKENDVATSAQPISRAITNHFWT